jgi:hypothetical protein
MGNIDKGKRIPSSNAVEMDTRDCNPTTITPDELKEYLAELKRRPGTPIPCLQEDAAVVQGLIDLLIVKNVIKDDHPDELIIRYAERYNSIVTGLVMLLIDKKVITETEMDSAILAFHHGIRHFGTRQTTFQEVSGLRRDTLRSLLNK